jgi:hypothetical protein
MIKNNVCVPSYSFWAKQQRNDDVWKYIREMDVLQNNLDAAFGFVKRVIFQSWLLPDPGSIAWLESAHHSEKTSATPTRFTRLGRDI